MGVQMYVSLSVGLMEIQTPALILMKFCKRIPNCPRKVLVQVWPCPLPCLGGLRPYKLKDTFLKTVYRTKDVQQDANLPGLCRVPLLVCHKYLPIMLGPTLFCISMGLLDLTLYIVSSILWLTMSCHYFWLTSKVYHFMKHVRCS